MTPRSGRRLLEIYKFQSGRSGFPIMVIVIGMFILITAIIAGAAALLSTGGDAHALTGDVTLFGYHATDT
ncbi:hypothetical protein AB0E01_45000, partial [Nocardia vinacea]